MEVQKEAVRFEFYNVFFLLITGPPEKNKIDRGIWYGLIRLTCPFRTGLYGLILIKSSHVIIKLTFLNSFNRIIYLSQHINMNLELIVFLYHIYAESQILVDLFGGIFLS